MSWDPDGAGTQPELLYVGGTYKLAHTTLVKSLASWEPLFSAQNPAGIWRDVAGGLSGAGGALRGCRGLPVGVGSQGWVGLWLRWAKTVCRRYWLDEFFFQFVVVVARGVAGLLGPFQFGVEFADDSVLNHLAATRVDRMGDVGVQLDAS